MQNVRLLYTLLDQNKSDHCKEEIYFFRPDNLYPAPEISNWNLIFKLCWGQKYLIELHNSFPAGTNFDITWIQRFLENILRDSCFFTRRGLLSISFLGELHKCFPLVSCVKYGFTSFIFPAFHMEPRQIIVVVYSRNRWKEYY